MWDRYAPMTRARHDRNPSGSDHVQRALWVTAVGLVVVAGALRAGHLVTAATATLGPFLTLAVVIAPVTRTVRGIPTEIALGEPDGLDVDCAASFDNLQPIRRSFLASRVSAGGPRRRAEICSALAALADC